MAAPTASPVNPASEIGVSSTRSLPNSSSSPESTLNGVPASATSSPMMQTVESRRISSASASRIACANVSSRVPAGAIVSGIVSGIDILFHFTDSRIRRSHRELDRFFHFAFKLGLHISKRGRVGQLLFDQPFPEVCNRIPLRLPLLLFLFRTVVFAVDISDVVSVIAIRIAKKKGWPVATPRAIYQPLRSLMHSPHV